MTAAVAAGNTGGLTQPQLDALFSTVVTNTAAAADGTIDWTFDAPRRVRLPQQRRELS